MTFDFIEGYFVDLATRINEYNKNIIIYAIDFNERHRMPTKALELEGEVIRNTVIFIILSHIAFYLYVMLHAFSGQYVYIPILTENSEIHIGKRDPNSVYSGGNTAWQTEEPPKNIWVPKFWYGWFGRGSKAPNIIWIAIKYLIYKPIFNIVLMILKIFRRKR